MQLNRLLLASAALLGAASGASAQVTLNEIYISHTGTDTAEFIELKGAPGTSLAGYMVLVVEGDGAAAGTLDRAYNLGNAASPVIPASGYFVISNNGATIQGQPVQQNFSTGVANDALENGTDTFYLVQTANPAAITALVTTNIATGTTTSIPSLATILDIIAVIDPPPATGADVTFDGATVLGPEVTATGTFLPAGIYRPCDGAFSNTLFLDFDPNSAAPVRPPTPGAINGGCAAAPGVVICEPGVNGVIACPCANNGNPGAGCNNSANSGGAVLSGSGVASTTTDALVLTASGIATATGTCAGFNDNLTCILLQGTSLLPTGVAFGDGVRCFGGTLKRINVGASSAGVYNFGPGVVAQSAALGDAFVTGDTRFYLVYYRDACASFCPSANFNATQGYQIVWQ
jgi:hypothetical protein